MNSATLMTQICGALTRYVPRSNDKVVVKINDQKFIGDHELSDGEGLLIVEGRPVLLKRRDNGVSTDPIT